MPKPPPVDLSWKFTKGDTFTVTHYERLTTTADLGNGLKINAIVATVVEYKLTVLSTDAKQTVLDMVFVRGVKGAGGGKNPGIVDIDDLRDRSVAVTLDPAQAITAVEGADDPDGHLKACGFLRERSVRAQLNELLRAVPSGAVAEGGTWTTDREEELAKGLTAKRTERGTVAGTTDGLTELSATVDVTLTDGVPGSTVYQLSGVKQPRTVLFDAKAGRVRKVSETYELSGTVEDRGAGCVERLPMSQKRVTKITVTDEKPKAKK